MEKISINLLPQEFSAQQKERSKFVKVQFISIAALLLLIFLSSISVVLRVLQSQNIKDSESRYEEVSQKVTSLKSTEASLVLLKNRLGAIDKITSTPSKQRTIYELVNKLLPPTLQISSIGIDGTGNMNFSLVAPDSESLDTFINSLISQESNEGKIDQVSAESLSRGRDGLYRANLRIKSK